MWNQNAWRRCARRSRRMAPVRNGRPNATRAVAWSNALGLLTTAGTRNSAETSAPMATNANANGNRVRAYAARPAATTSTTRTNRRPSNAPNGPGEGVGSVLTDTDGRVTFETPINRSTALPATGTNTTAKAAT